MQELWTDVDRYLAGLLAPADEALAAAVNTNREANLPAIDVPPPFGKFLGMLATLAGAKRVLEIGTLGGYSTIWLARALPADGQLVTLELEPRHAEIARGNLERAGVLERVEIRIGPAAESLRELCLAGEAAFDFVFIDADKKSMPEYLDWSLKLARKGTVIVADNVIRDGKVIDRDAPDPHIQGVRRFLELAAANPRLNVTALQTVDSKGYDGFAMAVVLG